VVIVVVDLSARLIGAVLNGVPRRPL